MWNRVAYAGNWLACFEYRTVTCEHCHGEGMVKVSKEELREQLIVKAFGLTWQKLMEIYREWKRNGHRIVCPECNGRGRWEERR